MNIRGLALALVVALLPLAAHPQETGTRVDEQVLLKKVMSDKRDVYAQNLGLTEPESRAFWPIYDEYEARVKKLDDRFIALVNDYAQKYDTLSDADAAAMLKEKMSIEKQRMDLKQAYTRKIARVLPAKKALRYAQVETRIDNMLRRDVYGLIPLAR